MGVMQTVPRLYNTFQPDEYRLHLNLNRPERTFRGTVNIHGSLSEDAPLTVHSKDLVILSVSLNGEPINSYKYDGDLLEIDAEAKAGEQQLSIEYEGTITDAMHGLYPCYFEVDGEKKELLATQFESHHAREVFPCIDEPEAKAVFTLTLETEANVSVLGNMPVQTSTDDGDRTTTVFEPTPKMSTYLLAFVVGELHKQSATTKSGVKVSVWATKAQPLDSLDFPLEVAVKTIDFFDDYFGVRYPLPKADHVALPDFSSGAMENWGLITYREIALLVDKQSSVSMREYVATVIAHETSHQWFGNLVTMKWWDDLWLNESFATIMEYVAIDALYPGWNAWNTFASQETLSALRRDQLAGVQAVKSEVNHPDEISTLFDPSIVYAKGGRLLKMLRAYIGEAAFRDGLRAYFNAFAYQNTVGSDLWQAFSTASGKDIGAFMEKWLSQSGFPVVTVTTTPDGYELSQQRMIIGADADDSTWTVPLFAHDSAFPEQLSEASVRFEAKAELPLLNHGNEAHFVAAYDEPSWSLILDALRADKLDIIDRLALLHETSLLAKSGHVQTSILIPLLANYTSETAEPVWNIVSMIIGDLKRFVEEDESSEIALKALVKRLALPLYEKLGFEQLSDESEQDTKLRATIVGLLSYSEHQPVIDAGLTAFHETADLVTLPSELRAIVIGIAARYGSDDDFERLLTAHQTTSNAELRDDLTSGLCSTKNRQHAVRLIERLTDSESVKHQDVFRWYVYLLRNRYARDETWRWMTTHWDWIEKNFKGDKSYDDFARYSAGVLATRQWLDAFNAFFTPLEDQTALKRAITVGRTEISTRAAWLERDVANVRATLAQENS